MTHPCGFNKLSPFKFSAMNELHLSIKEGLSVNFVETINKYDMGSLNEIINDVYTFNEEQEVTLLMEATLNGRLEIIKCMLTKFNINLNAKGKVKHFDSIVDGATALWCAAGCGQLEIVKVLVENGADVDCCTKTESTPLRAACYLGQLDIVKYLVEHGANVNKTDILGSTCLIIASHKGHNAVVGYLLENGADVDKQTNCGATALHFAAQAGHKTVINLVKFNAKNLKNEHSLTPIMVGAERAHMQVVVYLEWCHNLTRNEKIEARELLGASLFLKNEENEDSGFDFLLFSMRMRFAVKPIKHKKVYKKVEAYGNRVECQTIQDLLDIKDDSKALRYESLIIRERILGDKNPDLLPSIIDCGAVYLNRREYIPCYKLWLHAMKIAQKNQSSILEDLRRFIKLFFEDNFFQITLLELKTVLEVAKEELQRIKTKLLTSPADEKEVVEREYSEIILSTVGLIYLTSKYENNSEDEQKKEVFKVIVEIIKLKVKTKEGQTLLHLSLAYETKVEPLSSYGFNCFPDYSTMKLLIDCGADVNSVDNNRNTPLHYVDKIVSYIPKPGYAHEYAQSDINIKKVVLKLLKSGAHIDFVNNHGVCPHTRFLITVYNLSNKNPTSLQCLAARRLLASLHKYFYDLDLPKKFYVLPSIIKLEN